MQVLHLYQDHQLTEAASNSRIERDENITRKRLTLGHKIPSFGFDNIISNWTFLSFLQYFGDDISRKQVGYELSYDFFKVITAKDPRFLTPYIYLTNSVSIYAGSPEKAISLMQAGLEKMSPTTPNRSYLVWRYKGTDELLFLGDGQAAEQSFRTAAQWADKSDDPESNEISQLSLQTAQFLAKNPHSREAQIGAWSQVLVRAVNLDTREIAIQRIEELGGEVVLSDQGRVEIRHRVDEINNSISQ